MYNQKKKHGYPYSQYIIFICVLCQLIANDLLAQSSEWQSRGPWRGVISRLIVYPENPHKLYALNDYGIYVSIDAGVTWSNTSWGIEALWYGRGLQFLTMSPENPQIMFTATYGLGSAIDGFLYRSVDGGVSWQLVTEQNIGLPLEVNVDQFAPDVLYAATSRGYFRSTDDGRTWVATYNRYVYDVEFDPFHPGRLYAGTADGLMISNDGGLTWAQTNSRSPFKPATEVILDPSTPDRLYWRTPEAVLVTYNGGKNNWLVGEDYFYPILVDRHDPRRIFAGYASGVQTSIDRGENWQLLQVIEEGSKGWIAPLAQDPVDPQVIYAGGGYGIFISADGGATWQRFTRGLGGSVSRIRFNLEQPGSVYTGSYRSIDQGRTWTDLGFADRYEYSVVDPVNFAVAYRIAGDEESSWIEKTEDRGVTWHKAGLEVNSETGIYDDITINPNNTNELFATTGRLYRSEDGGESWSRIANVEDVTSIALHPRDGALYIISGDALLKTEDHGETWEIVNRFLSVETRYPLRITDVEIHVDGTLFAITNKGLLKSVDGNEWHAFNEYLPPTEIRDIAIDPTDPNTIYLATATGVYVFTHRRSTEVSATEEAIDTYLLGQNYPNPFNAETRIQYNLSRSDRVELIIYDILGRPVRVLVDENQQAGYHQIIWNGLDGEKKRQANGVYIYRLSTSDYLQSRAMVLVK
jgi:photosystem II stability/assembly factor-like uncharacterized protein